MGARELIRQARLVLDRDVTRLYDSCSVARAARLGIGGGTGLEELQASRRAPRPPRRVLAAAVMILAVAGIVACSTSPVPNPSSSSTGPTSSPAGPGSSSAQAAGITVCVTPVVTCTDEMKTEPSVITPSADGAVYIWHLTWSDWGADKAVGSGTLERDNCQPNCATGTDVAYPATVTLSDPTPYGDGEQAYAIMTISAPGRDNSETFKGLLP